MDYPIMVWNPEKKEVDVKRMMIYSVIPFLSVYSQWRIQKFWVINILLLPFGIMNQIAINYTEQFSTIHGLYSYLPLVIVILTLVLGVLLTKNFAEKYNLSLQNIVTED
jgi:hypothetical protein